jgi:hypothetical protein
MIPNKLEGSSCIFSIPVSNPYRALDFEDSHRPGNFPQGAQYFLVTPTKRTIERKSECKPDLFQTFHASNNVPHFMPSVVMHGFDSPKSHYSAVKMSLHIDRDRFDAVE